MRIQNLNLIHSERKSYVGMKFGYLTAIKPTDKRSGSRGFLWVFRCDCGNEIEKVPANVRLGHPKSCGCMTKYLAHKNVTLPEGEAPFRQLYRAYKQGAKLRGYSFELSMDEFRDFTKQACWYCGIEPRQEYWIKKKNIPPYIYNGVDRLNNSDGYTIENSVPCCGTCNGMKSDMNISDFISKIKSIFKHRALF